MSEYFPRTEYQDNIMSEFFKKTNMKQMENGSGGCSWCLNTILTKWERFEIILSDERLLCYLF